MRKIFLTATFIAAFFQGGACPKVETKIKEFDDKDLPIISEEFLPVPIFQDISYTLTKADIIEESLDGTRNINNESFMQLMNHLYELPVHLKGVLYNKSWFKEINKMYIFSSLTKDEYLHLKLKSVYMPFMKHEELPSTMTLDGKYLKYSIRWEKEDLDKDDALSNILTKIYSELENYELDLNNPAVLKVDVNERFSLHIYLPILG